MAQFTDRPLIYDDEPDTPAATPDEGATDRPLIHEGETGGIGPSIQHMLETGLPLAGGMLGGALGATAGALTGPGAVVASPVKAAAFAGLGATAGRTVAEITRPLLTDEEARPILEQYKNIIQEGLLFGVSEGAAPAVASGLKATGRFFTSPIRPTKERLLDPTVQRTREIMQQYGRQLKGVKLPGTAKDTPADLSLGQITGGEGGIVDIFENIAANAFLGVRRAGRFFMAQQQAVKNFGDEIIKGFGAKRTNREMSKVLTDVIEGNLQTQIPVRRALFDQVRQLAGDHKVKTKELARIFSARSGRDSTEEIKRRIFDVDTRDLTSIREIPGMPEGANHVRELAISIDKAIQIRSRLNEIVRERGLRDPVGREANELLGRMKGAIQTSMPRQVNDTLKFADEFVRTGEEMFNNRFIRRLVGQLKDERGLFSEALLKPHRPDSIEKVRTAVGDKIFDGAVAPRLARTMIEEAADQVTGFVKGEALIRKINNLGPEMMLATFGKDGAKQLNDLARAAITAETRATGPGRIFIQLAQAGAGAELVSQPISRLVGAQPGRALRTAAAVTVIGPAALGKILFDPRVVRLLTDGLEATTEQALSRSISHLGAFVTSKRLQRQQERLERLTNRELLFD